MTTENTEQRCVVHARYDDEVLVVALPTGMIYLETHRNEGGKVVAKPVLMSCGAARELGEGLLRLVAVAEASLS